MNKITPEEAIEFLNDIYMGSESNMLSTNNPNLAELWLMDCQALRMAIEALDKQIPKNPLAIRTRDLVTNQLRRNRIVTEFKCPCCKDFIICDYEIKRCIECGQAIDWGDDDE